MKKEEFIPAEGDYITVVEWKFAYANGQKDRSWIGDIFKVLAVDGDLVLSEKIVHNHYGAIVLNTKEVEIRQISEAFADKLIKTKD